LAALKYAAKSKGKTETVVPKKETKTTKIKMEAIGTNAMVGNKTAKGVLDLESLAFAQVCVANFSILFLI
jgi:hypothetical protein